jgi:WD40 repeat protein
MTGHTGEVRAIRFFPSGASIVSASADHTVKIWETATGRARTIATAEGELYSVAYTRDSQYVVAGSGGLENKLRFWFVGVLAQTGLAKTFTQGGATINCIQFSGGGAAFAYGSDNGVLTYANNPFPVPFTINSLTNTPSGLALSWIGAGAPYQVQTRPDLTEPWSNYGALRTNSSAVVTGTADSTFVRVLGAE